MIPVTAKFCHICLCIAKTCWDCTSVYTEGKTLSSNPSSFPALLIITSLAGCPHDYMYKTEQLNLHSFSSCIACPLFVATPSQSTPQGQCETVSATVKLFHNLSLFTFFIFPHPYYFCQAFLTSHDYLWMPQTPCNGKLWMLQVCIGFSKACPKIVEKKSTGCYKIQMLCLAQEASESHMAGGWEGTQGKHHTCLLWFYTPSSTCFWPLLEKACWAWKIFLLGQDRQFLHHEQGTQHFSSVLLLQR